ncbi:hypothetical protein Tco_0802458 [Tanacetum coccineum]|uniref:Uncharacterized protein n=1 Tax=Tanacetum coccineum TaxID=301880 RepID=A0ABQ4ZYV1_9ASTR
MSTQQDIYAAGFENRPHMFNKYNYVLWSSRLICYAKSKPNGKLIYNSIMHDPYVIRMIPEPGNPDCEVPVAKTFHEQTDDELTDKEVKQMEADDQAIQTILMGLPEDIYVDVDSCKTAHEIWNQNGYNAVQNVENQNVNQNGNGNVVAAQAKGNGNGNNGNQLLIAQKEEAGIQLLVEEFDLMVATGDPDDIDKVNANCILMANFNKHRHQYTELLKPIFEPHQVQQNDSNVISTISIVEQSGGTIEQNLDIVEETRAYFESLYNNLAVEVEKVNTVNHKMKEINADLTTQLARYKSQEKYFEINQEKYDKLERCYQKSVYQDQCLTKKINALHLSFAKTIMTLNEEIANLNNQLSKAKSTVSNVQQEKKKLKSDFKIHEDELLDK